MSVPRTQILLVDPTSSEIAKSLAELADDMAVTVQRAGADDALEVLRAGSCAPELVVLGPRLSNPLGLARRMHRAAPHAHFVFVASAERESELRAAAAPTALIGGDFDIASASAGDLIEVLRHAAATVRKRNNLRATLARLNERLARLPNEHERSNPGSTDELERLVAERAEELARVNEALAQSNFELQQFTYVASHDLQSPLRSLAGFAQLLQRDYGNRLDAQAHLWLERIVENAKRMQSMMVALQEYSRSDAACAFAPADMQAAFNDALRSLDEEVRESQAEVTCAELPTVQGDLEQLTQLLRHLLENALKFRGAEPLRIEVSARPVRATPGEWLFSVADNGIGIEVHHRQRIFETFQRLHVAREHQGTGVGLAICRRIVQRHGGRIWVESAAKRGSVFYFTLARVDR